MNYILPRKLSAKLRADYIGLLVQFLPNGYAMLMRPNKAETAVHGCHCLGDMAVRMRKVLARPWVGVQVCHLFLLSLGGTGKILKFFKTSWQHNASISEKTVMYQNCKSQQYYNFWTTKYLIITLFYSFPSKEQNCVLSTMKKNISYALLPVPLCPFLPLCTWHVFRSLGLIIWLFNECTCTVEWQS